MLTWNTATNLCISIIHKDSEGEFNQYSQCFDQTPLFYESYL